MRRWLLGAMVVSLAGIAALPVAAQEMPRLKKPIPLPIGPSKPVLKITLPPSIAAVRLSLESAGEYSSGAVKYDIEVVNPSGNPELEGNLVIKENGTERGRSPVRVPAGTRAWIKVADSSGADGCRNTSRVVELEGTDIPRRLLSVTPSCRFSAEAIDPSASLTPDRKLAQRQGKLYYHSMSAPTNLRCGEVVEGGRYEGRSMQVQATLRNSGAAVARDIRLRFRDAVSAGSSAVELAPGQERRIEARTTFDGDERDYVLEISGAGVPLHQPRASVRTSRRCRLSVIFLA